ncbi:hypothetical protein [Komagataeibacter medellinensis]|uniref:hypothetical protein n=1 Tax=Komagataeibacter medellinensis TaxID=1177712 RepID=UPI00129560FD|nr:hypothetical protein [Komagataeibacter medellinensis]
MDRQMMIRCMEMAAFHDETVILRPFITGYEKKPAISFRSAFSSFFQAHTA